MPKFVDYQVKIEEANIPLRVFIEWRNNVKISVGKKHVILRIPRGLRKKELEGYMDWAEEWIHSQYHKSDLLKNRFIPKEYKTGDTLTLLGRVFTIHISYELRKSHGGKIIGHDIYLKLSNQDKTMDRQRAIKQLLSRLVSHSFAPFIKDRVFSLNDRFFRKSITNVKMKYTSSRWGSCSSKGNLNLSSRLLFAPLDVLDYVIIHELAHLTELNHSPRFWKLVSDAMPDYKLKEKWLKVHGAKCDF